MTKSLGFRLLSGAAMFISLALLLTWLTLTRLFETHVAAQIERELISVIDTMAAQINRKDGRLLLESEPSDPRYAIPAGGRYWQVWLVGAPLLRSRSLWDKEIKYSQDPEAYGNLVTMTGPAGAPLLAYSQKLNVEGNGDTFDVVLTAAADRAEFDASVSGFNRSLLQMLAVTALGLFAAAALQVRYGLRPLDDMQQAVAKVRSGSADRIDDAGPAEVRPLVNEINTLLMSERAAVERARARASDLAHGLKTPLTILSQIGETLAGTGQSALAASIHEQVNMVRSRTDRQLALSRIAATGKSSVEAAVIVEKLVGALRQMPSHAPISWNTRIAAGLLAAADPGDFAEAVGNVLDNARLHAKSCVRISAALERGRMRLCVEDDGQGIPEADYGRVLARGLRLDESAEGSGLGLAITSDVIRAYGGALVLDRAPIGGLKVSMEWPIPVGQI